MIFDVQVYNEETKEWSWLNPEAVELYAEERGFDHVPVLYRGPYNKEEAYKLTFGPSVYCPKQKVREGVVIKSRLCYNDKRYHADRKSVKWISEDYLNDPTNSDQH